MEIRGDSNVGFDLTTFDIDTTMTDAQVKSFIEAKLAEKGMTGANVVVARDAQGKRRIEVNGNCTNPVSSNAEERREISALK